MFNILILVVTIVNDYCDKFSSLNENGKTVKNECEQIIFRFSDKYHMKDTLRSIWAKKFCVSNISLNLTNKFHVTWEMIIGIKRDFGRSGRSFEKDH